MGVLTRRDIRVLRRNVQLGVLGLVIADALLHLGTEVANETLHGPCRGITKSANSVALDLVGELLRRCVSTRGFNGSAHL